MIKRRLRKQEVSATSCASSPRGIGHWAAAKKSQKKNLKCADRGEKGFIMKVCLTDLSGYIPVKCQVLPVRATLYLTAMKWKISAIVKENKKVCFRDDCQYRQTSLWWVFPAAGQWRKLQAFFFLVWFLELCGRPRRQQNRWSKRRVKKVFQRAAPEHTGGLLSRFVFFISHSRFHLLIPFVHVSR